MCVKKSVKCCSLKAHEILSELVRGDPTVASIITVRNSTVIDDACFLYK
jgi:hypothetical protein